MLMNIGLWGTDSEAEKTVGCFKVALDQLELKHNNGKTKFFFKK